MEIWYRIEAKIEPNGEYYTGKRQKLGRFVLATNDLDLDPDRLLANYKNQAQVERGFRFLKDNSSHVSEIFLKKNTRIEALAMIMTISLFIYSLTVGSGRHSKSGMKPSRTRNEDQHKSRPSRESSSSFGQSKSWYTRGGTIVRR